MTNLPKNQWKTYKRIIAFVRYISLNLSRHGVKVGPGPQDPGPQDPGTPSKFKIVTLIIIFPPYLTYFILDKCIYIYIYIYIYVYNMEIIFYEQSVF